MNRAVFYSLLESGYELRDSSRLMEEGVRARIGRYASTVKSKLADIVTGKQIGRAHV